MEEKAIIKSKLYNPKKILIGILVVGLIAATAAFFIGSASEKSYQESPWRYNTSRRDEVKEMSLIEFAFSKYNNNFESGLFFSILAGFIVIGLIFYFGSSKIKITVTNKRVYGNAAFGKRVDLPLDSISAIGTSAFKGVSVATSSGKIKFALIKNRDDIHKAISRLLIQRQKESRDTNPTISEAPKSNVNEIKQYKELLDSGVITQEEFDAKKKQLLGL